MYRSGAQKSPSKVQCSSSVEVYQTVRPLTPAGSVFEADGRYHAFYTGYNRDYPAAGKAAQVLMHAVSDDLEHWTTLPGELVAPEPGLRPRQLARPLRPA